jgi:hypothetical protein
VNADSRPNGDSLIQTDRNGGKRIAASVQIQYRGTSTLDTSLAPLHPTIVTTQRTLLLSSALGLIGRGLSCPGGVLE